MTAQRKTVKLRASVVYNVKQIRIDELKEVVWYVGWRRKSSV